MLIGRCAWHVQYFGHPRWDGVASWRGFNVRFTDGICARCLERFRKEHRATLARRRSSKVAETLRGPVEVS
jgi:hypothetical protein